jgi:hypothetical protein
VLLVLCGDVRPSNSHCCHFLVALVLQMQPLYTPCTLQGQTGCSCIPCTASGQHTNHLKAKTCSTKQLQAALSTSTSTAATDMLLQGLGCQQHHTCLMECTPMAAYGKDVSTFATRSNLLKSQQPGPCSEQQQGCRQNAQ